MNHNKTDSSADNAEDCIWEGFLFYFILFYFILFYFILFDFILFFSQLKTKCQIPV